MKTRVAFILLLICSVLTPARGAEEIYLSIQDIPGEVRLKGKEGMMEVYGWSHEIISPRDAASGLPTGKRIHTPFRAVIRMSQSTPLLQEAMTRNTVIPEVRVSFWREVELGAPVRFFSYVLKNCQVTSMRVWKPNKLDPSVSNYVSSVEVAFVYRTIEWRYEDGGITHEDTWESPVN